MELHGQARGPNQPPLWGDIPVSIGASLLLPGQKTHSKIEDHLSPPRPIFFLDVNLMVGHCLDLCLNDMNSFVKMFPKCHCPQFPFSHRVYFESPEEEVLHIVIIEKFCKPANHQTLQALTVEGNLLFDPRSHSPQVGDEMEERFSCMFEKAFQVCPVNDKANVSRVV